MKTKRRVHIESRKGGARRQGSGKSIQKKGKEPHACNARDLDLQLV